MKYKTYQAEYDDDNFQIFDSQSDIEALKTANNYTKVNLKDLFEIDEYYNKIRQI